MVGTSTKQKEKKSLICSLGDDLGEIGNPPLEVELCLQNIVLSVLPPVFCHLWKILRRSLQRGRNQVLLLTERFNMPDFPWVWGTLGSSGFGTSALLLKLRGFEPLLWLEGGVSWGLGPWMMCPSVHGCGLGSAVGAVRLDGLIGFIQP